MSDTSTRSYRLCLRSVILLLSVSFATFFFFAGAQAADLTVNPAAGCGPTGPYCTIQAAIDAAGSGDVINIVNGTYPEKLTIYKSLTLQGESRAGVIINASTFTGYAIDAQGDYAFVFKNFTLDGPDTDASGNYGLKVSGENATVTIEDVSVIGTGRSGIDLNGLSGGALKNISSVGALKGVGIGLTDCSNVTLENITTSGNAWGGVAIYTWGLFHTGGSDNISLTGVNSFSEANQFYIEAGNYSTPASPLPVTNFTQTMFPYLVTNSVIPGTTVYTFYQTTAAGAAAFANTLPAPWAAPQPDKSIVTVLPTGSIQAAIDAADPGDTIQVAAGVYVEQPLITKNLTLAGAGSTTIIKAPATLVARFTTVGSDNITYSQYPVLTVSGANATIRDLVIDGAGRGNSAYKFSGIAYYNAGGAIVNTEIKGVRDTSFSGAQHGVALYAYLVDGSTRNLAIRNNYIHDFQKNAMAVNSGGSSVLTTQIVGNRIEGAGPTAVTAQNGIQVYRASGTLDGYIDSNFVTGIAYTGGDWVATTILNYYADVDVTNNVVTNGHVGVYNIDAQGAIANNKIDVIKAGGYAWGIIATDPPEAVPSPYEVPMAEAAATSEDNIVGVASATEMPVNVSGNVVTLVSSSSGNAGTYGIEADAGYGPRSINITANRNVVTGFKVGLEFYQCVSVPTATPPYVCPSTAPFTAISANYNNLAGNTIGMRSNASYLTADGTNNWWGDASGPSGEGPGSGAEVSPYITYNPWLNAAPTTAVLSVPADPIILQRTDDPKVINVPVILTPEAGDQIASVAFSVDYDQNCLVTDASKVTGMPAGFMKSVAFDAADTDGEIDVAIWSEVSNPLVLAPGNLLSIEFTVKDACWGADRFVDVLFSNQPASSFGNPGGQTLFRTSAGASIPLDFNDAPTGINLSGSNSVAENAVIGTPVGTFSPVGDTDTDPFVYTLVNYPTYPDNAAFTIENGVLKTAAIFDFETKFSYTILVKLDDGKGGVVTKEFTITITNVNEAPTDIMLSNDKVFEAVPVGTEIGTFTTSDPEGGAFTYELVTGFGDNTAFVISSVDKLLINEVPDYSKPTYSIKVRSIDSSGLFYEKQFTIHVIDRSELSLPVETDLLWVAYSGNVQVPVNFKKNLNAVRGASFSIDYDETCLTFTGLSGYQSSSWNGAATAGTGGVQAIGLNGSADLADGVAVVLNFSANNACDSGEVSDIKFTGATSLKNVSNAPLPVLAHDGALHIVANDARGDCNSDDIVNAADFVAEVIESFDANTPRPTSVAVNHWLYVHLGSFKGSAIGCDANASTLVDVADILCTVLVVFGNNSCTLPTVTTAATQPAVLAVPAVHSAAAGATVEVP
ncbi:cohesin domain-containing protein, partial [Caldilinea sp.]|uniref:cohesin domain-containing protein n=1 Tax=Caldilinea sp. TaxID=2293560 RepID=UPI002C66792A|nr:cohesin domain-containing protein [Caldilinea sp.]